MGRYDRIPKRSKEGRLSVHAGIVAGTVQQYAAALGTVPHVVLATIREAGVEVLNDTGVSKGQEKHERPKDPRRRCLAMHEAEFARLLVFESEKDNKTTGLSVRKPTV